MRRERQDLHISPEQKNIARQIQIDLCKEKANELNFDLLPDEALNAFQKIISYSKTGRDTTSSEFRIEFSDLISQAAPILHYGLNAGYIGKVFQSLKVRSYTSDPISSFSLFNISGSPDGQSHHENQEHIQIFQDCKEAWDIVSSWSQIDGAKLFLESIQNPNEPILLPHLRRDHAARTGGLRDFEGYIGGARLIQKTKIYGVVVENDYEGSDQEFPNLRVIVSKLR